MFNTLPIAVNDVTITWSERFTDPFLYNQTPLIVCALMGAVLGLIGCFVVLRRMALLGDALSHAILPGVVIAFLLLVAVGGAGLIGEDSVWKIWGLSIGALLAGLFTTFGVNLIARHSRVKEDTAIGITFTAMFALGVILIGYLPRGTHFDLKCFLFGEPLAIRHVDLYTALIVVPIVVGAVIVFYRPLKIVSFDAQMAAAAGMPVQFIHYLLMFLLSIAVVAALQSVGVIMSIAMLITPAAIAYQLTNRLSVMLVLSMIAGAVSAFVGMLMAFVFNMPPGPAMVIVATALFLVSMAFAPEYGVIAKSRRRARIRRHILEEDVLKSLVYLGGSATFDAIGEHIGEHASPDALRRAIRVLVAEQGFVDRKNGAIALTDVGRDRAEMLVRSHRIWETYLAEHNVPMDRIHDVAERLEHAHGTAEDAADELGHPDLDPHGEPIPAPKRIQP